MARLAPRLELQEALGIGTRILQGGDLGCTGGVGPGLGQEMLHQPIQGIYGLAVQALAAQQHPLIETIGIFEREAFQKVAAVERDGPPQALDAGGAGDQGFVGVGFAGLPQALELFHIQPDGPAGLNCTVWRSGKASSGSEAPLAMPEDLSNVWRRR